MSNYMRAIVQIKSSLAPNGETILFELDPVNGFQWAGTSTLTADEILNYTPPKRKAPARREAEEFLREALADGDRLSISIKDEARERGLSFETVKDAKRSLGIESRKKDNIWWWVMPPSVP